MSDHPDAFGKLFGAMLDQSQRLNDEYEAYLQGKITRYETALDEIMGLVLELYGEVPLNSEAGRLLRLIHSTVRRALYP